MKNKYNPTVILMEIDGTTIEPICGIDAYQKTQPILRLDDCWLKVILDAKKNSVQCFIPGDFEDALYVAKIEHIEDGLLEITFDTEKPKVN
jgi:hypothetical protein